MIRAGLYGIKNKLDLSEALDVNLYKADEKVLSKLQKLPSTLKDAKVTAMTDEFITSNIPEKILQIFCK